MPDRPLFVSFCACASGLWRIARSRAIAGEPLPVAPCLQVIESTSLPSPTSAVWTLSGVTSNVRYATTAEVSTLKATQPGLHRPQATCAALIPIRKNAAWWALGQDERRAIFEEQSHHTAVGLEYLPAIARRLHHSRELAEPFDFLTWFEYAPGDATAFDQLLRRMRSAPEWAYVEREVDIRLTRG